MDQAMQKMSAQSRYGLQKTVANLTNAFFSMQLESPN